MWDLWRLFNQKCKFHACFYFEEEKNLYKDKHECGHTFRHVCYFHAQKTSLVSFLLVVDSSSCSNNACAVICFDVMYVTCYVILSASLCRKTIKDSRVCTSQLHVILCLRPSNWTHRWFGISPWAWSPFPPASAWLPDAPCVTSATWSRWWAGGTGTHGAADPISSSGPVPIHGF